LTWVSVELQEREATQRRGGGGGGEKGAIKQARNCSVSNSIRAADRLCGAAQHESAACAPGQSWLGFNGPSNAAAALTGAGMAFIRTQQSLPWFWLRSRFIVRTKL